MGWGREFRKEEGSEQEVGQCGRRKSVRIAEAKPF